MDEIGCMLCLLKALDPWGAGAWDGKRGAEDE